jgi:hypothetical protein
MIRSLLIEIRRVVAFRWVKGHQDSLNSYDQLPREARLNIDADYLATRYRLRGKLKSTPKVDHHPSQRISISILGTRLTAQYDECICYHINGYHVKQYMQERKHWDDNTWKMIDLGRFGQHFKRLAPAQQTRHMKLVHDQLPLGKRRYMISQSKDDTLKKCPCCMEADEDPRHLLDVSQILSWHLDSCPYAGSTPRGLIPLVESSPMVSSIGSTLEHQIIAWIYRIIQFI